MTADNTQDLDLLAFRYVANEMADDERATFEARLADDQAACEAVAAAVELTQVLVMARDESLIRTSANEIVTSADNRSAPMVVVSTTAASAGRPLVWMSLGAAACLLVTTLVQNLLTSPRQIATPGGTYSASSAANNLAVMWSQIRQSDTAEDLEAAADDVDSTPSDPMAVSLSATPSWLTTAISGLSEIKKDAEAPNNDSNGSDDGVEL